jgi:acetylornithine/N-succinyldiaminopimelate aminotransferase
MNWERSGSLLGVYRPPEILFVRGEGTQLFDDAGRSYLDFTSGIGVNALGHGSPIVREAIESGLKNGLIHVSNLFRTQPAIDLAGFLASRSGLDHVFFCNSGAESVEGALKFSRKWARVEGGGEKHRIVALKGSFHGRLFGSLAVTDRPDYREPFEPLMPGVDFVDPLDLSGVDRALDAVRTAAIIVEPIQGEIGIRPLSSEFLQALRGWASERKIALIFDEVQCGLGRTGSFFAHESSDVRPDLLCIAKPLGGGLPMGAILLAESIAAEISPGDHGTTFGGGPLVSSVALAVVQAIGEARFLSEIEDKGNRLSELLGAIADRFPAIVVGVRGRGLFWGIELSVPAGKVVEHAREHGLLTVPAGKHVIRLLPPLTVSLCELEQATAILGEAVSIVGDDE